MDGNKEKIHNIFQLIEKECEKARKKHRPLASFHESYAVILEELDEWWESIKKDKPDDEELIQVAAMAVMTLVELGR